MRPTDRLPPKPAPSHPTGDVVAAHVATMLKESPMSVAASWVASELRRARFQEEQLRARLDSLGL